MADGVRITQREIYDLLVRVDRQVALLTKTLESYPEVKKAAYEGRDGVRALKEQVATLAGRFWAVILAVIGIALAVLRDWLGGVRN